MMKLISVTPDFATKGIFNFLQSLSPPWDELNIEHELDYEYYCNHSGDKYISPLFAKLLDGYDETETTDLIQQSLARICYSINSKRWEGLYNTLQQEYNPIENYNMVETKEGETVNTYGKTNTRTDNLSRDINNTLTDNLTETNNNTRTDNLSHNITINESVTETDVKTGTDTTTPDLTETNESDIYGFNSSSAAHANRDTKTTEGTQTIDYDTTNEKTIERSRTDIETNTGTETNENTKTNTGTQTTIEAETNTGTQVNALGGSDSATDEYTLTRHGNIGVTTTQQMLEQERNIWLWDFFRIVFIDVDKILTTSHYELGRL